MTFDLKRMLESKKALRNSLAARPVGEKLAMLDELRDRAISLRDAGDRLRFSTARETEQSYLPLRNRKIHPKASR